MYEVLSKKKIGEHLFQMDVSVPDIAKRAKPGQFVILRADERGKRIPIPISDVTGTRITFVFNDLRKSRQDLAGMRKGQKVLDVLGPLGRPNSVDQYGTVILVGKDFGIASLYLLAKALKKKGNKVITVIGGETRKQIFWDDKLKKASDVVHVCTEDGSMGRRGAINDLLRDLLRRRIDRLYVVGPLPMMKEVCKYTYQRVRTFVNIYANIMDGTGVTGSCRLFCNGEMKFASRDGPEFDGHTVNFTDLINRSNAHAEEEKRALRCK